MQRALFIVLLPAVFMAAAGVWVLSGSLSASVPREVGSPPAILAGAESVVFPSATGKDLHGWYATGVPGRGSVVLAHSVRSNRLSMVERARFLQRAGFGVLLFDFQAHGESPGDRITFGHLESRDAAAAVSYVANRAPASPVAFLGVSLGGAAAVLASPLPIVGLVLEAVYTSIDQAIANRVAIRLGDPSRFLAHLFLWQLEPRLGVPSAELAPIRRIPDVQAPVFVIAGERDRRATLDQSRALFAAAPEPKELWIVPEATHQDFHRLLPREYERRVLSFLEANLGSRGAR